VNSFLLYNLGMVDYATAFANQKRFIELRESKTPDEVWCLEHPPVYTLGLSGKSEHVLNQGDIPLVKSDRGGQVTYHGPGQLVIYLLLDLKRRKITVKHYVNQLEQAVIDTINSYKITAHRITGAPGVYVDGEKIAALGVRIRKGHCYHGISMNVDLDLEPFNGINPCGYKNLKVTRIKDLGIDVKIKDIIPVLADALVSNLGYDSYQVQDTSELTNLNTG
jgi:lipoyl(octanoyl) transferase